MTRYRFVPGPGDDDYEYWRGLAELWQQPHVIVNIEHDMEYSAELEAALIACPHPLCTYAYKVYRPERWAHSHSREGMFPGRPPFGEGDEWAAWSGIGFCKIAATAREGELARARWRSVELSVHHALFGNWHVHWPEVQHYHR